MSLTKLIGRFAGVGVAPLAALVSAARRARTFHPDGVLYSAEVRALGDEPLSRALEGEALVRLSGATWRWPAGAHRPDVLGIALRFHPAEAREQDLLFATFNHVIALPFAPLWTDAGDFLSNEYGTALPSRVKGLGRVEFRLAPEAPSPAGADRNERLERAVAQGSASFTLEARERGLRRRRHPLARITLRERIEGGGADMRFNPFYAGLGIEPAGFFQGVRSVVYPASQLGRTLTRPG